MIGNPLTQAIIVHVRRKIIPYTCVLLAFLGGILAGGFAGNAMDVEIKNTLYSTIIDYFSGNHFDHLRPTFDHVMREALMKDVLRTTCVVFLLGLTLIGAPFIFVMLFMRGFSLAFTFMFLIQENIWHGTVLTFVGLIPHNIFSFIGLFLVAAAAFTFVGAAFRILFGKTPVHYTIWRYLSSFILYTVTASLFVVAGMFIETYITPLLIEFALTHIV